MYAESYVEVLAVAKSQIAQSWVTKKFRKRLEKFSHAPPPVEDLHNMYKFKKFWEKVKKEKSTSQIRTTKHPKPVNKFGREWYWFTN